MRVCALLQAAARLAALFLFCRASDVHRVSAATRLICPSFSSRKPLGEAVYCKQITRSKAACTPARGPGLPMRVLLAICACLALSAAQPLPPLDPSDGVPPPECSCSQCLTAAGQGLPGCMVTYSCAGGVMAALAPLFEFVPEVLRTPCAIPASGPTAKEAGVLVTCSAGAPGTRITSLCARGAPLPLLCGLQPSKPG